MYIPTLIKYFMFYISSGVNFLPRAFRRSEANCDNRCLDSDIQILELGYSDVLGSYSPWMGCSCGTAYSSCPDDHWPLLIGAGDTMAHATMCSLEAPPPTSPPGTNPAIATSMPNAVHAFKSSPLTTSPFQPRGGHDSYTELTENGSFQS